MSGEYAVASANRAKIEGFKRLMRETAQRTFVFARRGVAVRGNGPGVELNIRMPLVISPVTEGVGHKTWVAAWWHQEKGDPSGYSCVAVDDVMMGSVDVLREGGLPLIYTCSVAAGTRDWFADVAVRDALARGYYEGCRLAGVVLVQGESEALPHLMRSREPVRDAPILSGCCIGVVEAPYSWFGAIRPGDLLFGVKSSGLHANGSALLIEKAMERPKGFAEVLSSGKTVGEEALVPTQCYVTLIEALLRAEVAGIRAIEPVTGGGVAAIFKRGESWTYRIQQWVEPPSIFEYPLLAGVPLEQCLTTFNWGIGLYLIVAERRADEVRKVSETAGWELYHLGCVEPGERKIIFEPEGA